jgi:hypothetical protein
MQPDLLQRNPISPAPTSAPPVQPPASYRNVPGPAATPAYPRQPRTGCRNVPSFSATARCPLHPGLLRRNLDRPAATRGYSLQLEIVRCNLSSSAAPWPLPPQPRESDCNVRWSAATVPSRLQRPQRGDVSACDPSHGRDSLQPGRPGRGSLQPAAAGNAKRRRLSPGVVASPWAWPGSCGRTRKPGRIGRRSLRLRRSMPCNPSGGARGHVGRSDVRRGSLRARQAVSRCWTRLLQKKEP